jgi:radical SAM superfamily enzyme YgiQ (UPF0313 family)
MTDKETITMLEQKIEILELKIKILEMEKRSYISPTPTQPIPLTPDWRHNPHISYFNKTYSNQTTA